MLYRQEVLKKWFVDGGDTNSLFVKKLLSPWQYIISKSPPPTNHCEARSPKKNNMKKSNYEVDIVVNGKPLKEYYHEDKTYIEGKKKTEFSLRIKNNGSTKIVAILSVDGLSAMNGKIASFNSGGYVINGYDSMIIDGWRKSDKEVARFYFSDPEDSYSQHKGDGNNLGIIGVAVFQEKHDIQKDFEELKREMDKKFPPVIPWIEPYRYHRICPWWHDHTWYGCNNGSSITLYNSGLGSGSNTTMLSANLDSTPTSNMKNVDSISAKINNVKELSQQLGTGWGEAKTSEVTSVNFDKEEKPSATFEIYYNTREQLEKIGIDFTKKPVYITPQAFPGQYCEPPKN